MTYDNDNEPAYPSYPKFIHRKHNKGIDLIIYKAEQIGTFMFSVLPCHERKRVAQLLSWSNLLSLDLYTQFCCSHDTIITEHI